MRSFHRFDGISGVRFFCCALLAPVVAALGQTPYLLSDINPGGPVVFDGGGIPLGVVGDRLVFLGFQSNSGTELWKTDGSAAGTEMVMDIRPGPTSFNLHTTSDPPHVAHAVMGGILYLSADDGTNGTQLWRTDGTPSGTWRVKRLYDSSSAVSIYKMYAFGTRLILTGPGSTNKESLWISDGTTAGTVEIPVEASLGVSGLTEFAEFNGDIVFMGGGGGLWRSDCTLAGTHKLVSTSSSLTPHMCVWNGSIYFGNASSGFGVELWKSDGTAAGSALLLDINPSSSSSSPNFFTPTASALYFFSRDATHGRELWKTDGTAAGTQLAVDFFSGTDSSIPIATMPFGTGLLVLNQIPAGTPQQIWYSDGTQAGTTALVAPTDGIFPSFAVTGNVAYFPFGTSVADEELWRTDGTVAGTYRVRDINPGASGSYPRDLFTWGSQVYFNADDGVHGIELWKSDGTSGGTNIVANVNAATSGGGGSNAFIDVGGRMFFVAGSNALYSSDGTTAGTVFLKQHSSMVYPPDWANVNGSLMYNAGSGAAAHLWKSDGTVAGTLDATPSSASLNPRFIVSLNGTALFQGKHPTLGRELYRSDGTQAGTSLVLDISVGSANSSPSFLFTFGTTALFYATTPAAGSELWRSDGTAGGTSMVADINPGAGSSADSNTPPHFCEFNGNVYFSANDGTHGAELWRTDGTSAGTSMVTDLNPGANPSLPHWFAVHDGWLYFSALDGQANGYSLFRTDGTSAGTSLVRRFGTPTSDSYYLTELASATDGLYFAVYSGATTSPLELWRSDGTSPGTAMFRQLGTGFNFQTDQGPGLTVIDGQPYFPGHTPETGAELWTTDGTEAGTHAIEVAPGPASGNPFQTTVGSPIVNAASGHYFYFLGDDGVTGLEPWAFVLPSRPFCPADYDHNDFVNGDDFDSFMYDFYYGLPASDIDHNGFVNGDDFDYFMDHFVAGC